MRDRIEQEFGNYRLIRLIGAGGFAEVYLGEHIHLSTQAAIKVLNTRLTGEDLTQFRNEARTVAQLEHPNIIRILDFGIQGSTPFMVMNYASNGTLADRHPRGATLSLADIVSYLKSIGAALQYAHDQNIIHRDIKPHNIFIGKNNELLLGDFGISVVVQSAHSLEVQNLALTPLYAAPEQFLGKAVYASDQYSLAVCVYGWLSGTPPFTGSMIEMQYQKLSQLPAPLYGRVSEVSQAMDAVVLKALAKEPLDRFPNIQTFIDAFNQAYQSNQSTIQVEQQGNETDQYANVSPINRVGQRFGNYRLAHLLGQGAFAEVYLGEHIHLKTEAAVKILDTRLTPEEVERFRAEARTIALLEHPSIIRLLEYGVEGRVPFLVMNYAPKGTLRQRHPKGTRLSPPIIAPYIKQIATALQYAHGHRLIHRDIKPDNILLGRNGEVLLSDFGIAVIAQSTHSSKLVDVAGTAPYMAPEQIQGKPRPASDQYALAVIAYEWLCGNQPFLGSLFEVYSQHLFTPPPSLCEKVSTLSSDIERVVMIALNKDPHERFASVLAFATAFEQASKE